MLATKLYVPPPRPNAVLRPHLVGRLREGLASGRKLTLISAPAGYGKTTLVSAWVAEAEQPVAWLSLDERDSDPTRFLTYLVAALQTVAPGIAAGILSALQAPQPVSIEALLTTLLNELAALAADLVLVLDDYHAIEAKEVDSALAFLVEHLPPRLHVVIVTREDPALPLARWRARNQLTEMRAADLRFAPSEAAAFLNEAMRLGISADQVAALEARTEGWIAGLQLAAISLRGRQDVAAFVTSFTGSHQFVLDYLVEEVLHQQPAHIQSFLVRTSMLDRMCGPLCDAVLLAPAGAGQGILEYLERSNLFVVPLDNERRWYRYHHLFAELLRQRMRQSDPVAQDHIRASQWFEANGLAIEAFQHAVAANDVERAARLMESRDMPLHTRNALNTILGWLASLPEAVLDAHPLLRVRSATMALTAGLTTGVEEALLGAEIALANVERDPQTRDLLGQIACARATLAVTRYQSETVAAEARRALEHLLPGNLRWRFTATWALSAAYLLQGQRAASRRALDEALALNPTSRSLFSTILATTQLGRLQEMDNQLAQAVETYRQVLRLGGDQLGPRASEACLGLARIHYAWNDLEAAEQYALQSEQLARLYDRVIDRYILSDVFLARLRLARGDAAGALGQLGEIEQAARQNNFALRLPDVAAAQVLALLAQGDVAAAARLAQTYDLPMSRARVLIAQGDAAAALALLEPLRQQMEARAWHDERLNVTVLQALAHQARGDKAQALSLLGEALALAEPGGLIRLFLDEGPPMARLLAEAAASGIMPGYVARLLAAFRAEEQPVPSGRPATPEERRGASSAHPLIEPLSQRELEILKLIALGLSNREIGARLFLALDTVKGHNRRLFDKLDVQSRTEAIARARALGLL
jgi:LuxR family maltose regulon positive regulatory protein